MDKFSKILDELRSSDLLHTKRESRLGERQGFALDPESLINPTERELGKFDGWLVSLDEKFGHGENPEVAGWPSEGNESGDAQPLAWYQPLSYFHETAGIYLTDYGIWRYAQGIKNLYIQQNKQQLFRTPLNIDSNQLISAAIEILLSHELFHHDVEWFALKQGATHKTHWLYPDYDTNVYDKGDPLEEALATARMQLHFRTKSVEATFGAELCANVIQSIHEEVPSLPPGYSRANHFSGLQSFRQGLRELSASINQISLTPRFKRTGAHFGIGKGGLSDYFRANVILVPWDFGSGTVLPPDSLAFSMPSRDIKRLLLSRGYWETNLGKGSHRVWKHKYEKAITLPERGNFEGHQVLKNICKSLGLDDFEALREATRDV
jgi:predicted RNA binding protein YcfA (HicA-like mRNA interferase family)